MDTDFTIMNIHELNERVIREWKNGNTKVIKNPRTSLCIWTAYEAIEAMREGTIDAFFTGDGLLYESHYRITALRFQDRAVGRHIAQATLSKLPEYEKRAAEKRMRCSSGGTHKWTHAECYDAYGIEYTLTCGKCGQTEQTSDWQTAIGIQVQNLGMEAARLEMDYAASDGCPPDTEKHLQEAKNVAAEALRLAQESA